MQANKRSHNAFKSKVIIKPKVCGIGLTQGTVNSQNIAFEKPKQLPNKHKHTMTCMVKLSPKQVKMVLWAWKVAHNIITKAYMFIGKIERLVARYLGVESIDIVFDNGSSGIRIWNEGSSEFITIEQLKGEKK